MRLLICGDRAWTDAALIGKWLDDLKPAVVIEGECRGADIVARSAAEARNITVEPYPAPWRQHGKAAGPIRNAQMLREGKPDRVLAFHDDIDNSSGTADMVAQAIKAGKLVTIISHHGIRNILHRKGFCG